MSESLFVLLQFSRHHLPCSEVETSQIHCVSKVTGQLRLTPELLPCRTEGRKKESQADKDSVIKDIHIIVLYIKKIILQIFNCQELMLS